MKCVFCKKYCGKFGHNALPVRDGRCCEECNSSVVIPARIKATRNQDVIVEELCPQFRRGTKDGR